MDPKIIVLLGVAAFMFLLSLIVGGFAWLMSKSDKEEITNVTNTPGTNTSGSVTPEQDTPPPSGAGAGAGADIESFPPMPRGGCGGESWAAYFTGCDMNNKNCPSRFGVNSMGKVYYSGGEYGDTVNDFVEVSSNFSKIAADGEPDATLVCGINSAGKIFCNDDPTITTNQWRSVGTRTNMTNITVTNGKIYGIDSNNNLYYYPNTTSTQNGTKMSISHKFKHIDADGDDICGITTGRKVYCSDDAGATWHNFPGAADQVAVGRYPDGKTNVYVIDDNNYKIFKTRLDGRAQDANMWNEIPGGLKQIDVNDGSLCGIGTETDNCIYCASISSNDDVDPQWVKMKGSLKQISLGGFKE